MQDKGATMKTCSKESGQRLVELGVERESYFKYVRDGERIRAVSTYEWSQHYYHQSITPAFTACELGEMLKEMNIGYRWNLAGEFECMFTLPNAINCYETYALDMAEAMALMLIWLLESGHITKEQP
jgi:hypothetical protein